MVKGRKPKPTAIKMIDGNPGKRPINRTEPIPIGGAGRPPAYLGREAKRYWRETVASMPSTLYTAADRGVLEAYCQQRAAMERLSRAMAKPDVTTDQLLAGNRELRQVADLIRRLGSELGLTPTARARMHVPDKIEAPIVRHGLAKLLG